MCTRPFHWLSGVSFGTQGFSRNVVFFVFFWGGGGGGDWFCWERKCEKTSKKQTKFIIVYGGNLKVGGGGDIFPVKH